MADVVTRPKPRSGWSAYVAKVDEATPASRDRAIDGYRALATLGVIVGHWLVGALVLTAEGLRISSPLQTMGALAPASWFLQMLGLFFLVGGYSAAISYTRSRERGSTYGQWLKARFVRLGRPVIAGVALSALALTLLAFVGVPNGSLRTWLLLFVQPLWFIAIYGAVTALAPYALAASRRFGAFAALPLIASVAVVDFLRYGPYASSVPGWVGMVNLLPGWLFAFQLGVSWAQGRLDRRAAWVLLGGGVALFALLIGVFDYPMSMVGVPGAERTNAHPPSLLVLALAAAQSGAAILLHQKVKAFLERRRGLWAGAAMVNLSAMTIFCWHQVPLVLVSLAGGALGGAGVVGLTAEPGGLGWLAARVAWLPVLAVVLGLIVFAVRRFEGPWTGIGRTGRLAAAVLVAGFAGYFVVLY
jgi:hypothetical protein